MEVAEKEGGTDPREVLMRQKLLQKRQTNSPVVYRSWIISVIGTRKTGDSNK